MTVVRFWLCIISGRYGLFPPMYDTTVMRRLPIPRRLALGSMYVQNHARLQASQQAQTIYTVGKKSRLDRAEGLRACKCISTHYSRQDKQRLSITS